MHGMPMYTCTGSKAHIAYKPNEMLMITVPKPGWFRTTACLDLDGILFGKSLTLNCCTLLSIHDELEELDMPL